VSLRKTFFHGLSWVALLRASTRGISIIKIAIIARLLTPSEVGLYGLAFLIISLLEVFTETGVNVFLIQEKKKLEEYVNTAWVISIVRGTVIALIIVLTARLVGNFFSAPELYNLLLLVAVVPLLRGFINPSLVKFQKEMNFKKDFWFRFIIFFVDALAAIIITWITKSPAGLIWGLIVGVIVEIVMSFVFIEPRPVLGFDKTKANLIINRGKWITGTGIFQYFFREGDDIFVGKIMGEAPLGIYQYAYRIATLPISEVADVFGKVALPLFVNIADDKKKLRKLYVQSTLGITLLVLPFAAAPVLQVLVIYSVIRAAIEPAMRVFLAVKKQEYTSIVTLVSLLVLAVMIYPLSTRYGLVGVGMATIIASLVSVPIVIFLVTRVLRDE
jgi:O-antigen/teichoic acid export membrane protein